MNVEVKERWVTALRSDDYRPGRLALRRRFPGDRDDEWCCLGVLCDLAERDGVVTAEPPTRGNQTYKYAGNGGILPVVVTRWAGLDSSDPTVDDYTLSELNDSPKLRGRGNQFTRIAELIEEEL